MITALLAIHIAQGQTPWPVTTPAKQDQPASQNAASTVQPAVSNPSEEVYKQAGVLCRSHDNLACMDSLKKVTELNPNHSMAWNDLGVTFIRSGDYGEAEKAFRQQIKVDPTTKSAYNNLGRVNLHDKKYDDALLYFTKQLTINPDDIYAPGNIGLTYEAKQKYEKAIPYLEDGIKRNSSAAEPRAALANCYTKIGNGKKASDVLDTVAGFPNTASYLNDLAYYLAIREEYLNIAQRYAESAVTTTETDLAGIAATDVNRKDLQRVVLLAHSWDTLGWVDFQLQKFGSAAKYLEAAWSINQSALIADHLGQADEKLGRLDDAARYYAAAAILHPSVEEAKTRWAAIAQEKRNFADDIQAANNEIDNLQLVEFKIETKTKIAASAYVVLGQGPKLLSAEAVSEAANTPKQLMKELDQAKWPVEFPDHSLTSIIRVIDLRCEVDGQCKAELKTIEDAVWLAPVPSFPCLQGPLKISGTLPAVDPCTYLSGVLAKIRTSWYQLIPESARTPIMKHGKVVIAFDITREGKVEGVKVENPSGDITLDHAAWQAVTSASPLPNLPLDFNIDHLSLRFTFWYNPTPADLHSSH